MLSARPTGRFPALPALAGLLAVGLLVPAPASGAVLRVEVRSRAPVLGGKTFGGYGPYEILRGKIVFGLDPASPANARIVDLLRAPRDAKGLVEATGDLVVVKPADPAHGRGVALVEVSNRGGKFSPRYFDRASRRDLDPEDPEAWGDGLLMRLGLTVVWVGWEFDVPEKPDLLRLTVPVAHRAGRGTIVGLVRSDWTVDEPTRTLDLGHRGQRGYPVADPEDPAIVLTVRDGRDAPRRAVPRSEWRFAREESGKVVPDRTAIYRRAGFEAGRIYELVYRSQDPPVVGCGLAAIRDVVSYAKYDPASLFPVRLGLAVGVSQTGRFLRHFLYQGFNTDEAGRKAYDGLLVITAGAGRGSFNHRFAQPSRDAHRYSAFYYPTDLFPFTSRTQTDPVAWRSDGLLAHLDPADAPKTFYVNTGYEYWGRAASLIHTSIDGTADVDPLPNERIYHLSSGQHYVRDFHPEDLDPMVPGRVFRGNPLDYTGNYRALLVRLLDWVDRNQEPPASSYPRIDGGTLVPVDRVAFPGIEGVRFPDRLQVAHRMDYGPRWRDGIIDVEPPRVGPAFPSLVPQVDALGNELGGVRNVELRVPVATYAPWNLRLGAPGSPEELTDFLGTLIPLPRTQVERERRHDPRPSLESLYPDRSAFLQRVRAEAQALVHEGFLLPDDVDRVVDRQGRYWDWIETLPRQ